MNVAPRQLTLTPLMAPPNGDLPRHYSRHFRLRMTNDESWDDEDEQRERDEMSERDVSDEDDDEAKGMTPINRHRKTRMDLLGILKENKETNFKSYY